MARTLTDAAEAALALDPVAFLADYRALLATPLARRENGTAYYDEVQAHFLNTAISVPVLRDLSWARMNDPRSANDETVRWAAVAEAIGFEALHLDAHATMALGTWFCGYSDAAHAGMMHVLGIDSTNVLANLLHTAWHLGIPVAKIAANADDGPTQLLADQWAARKAEEASSR